MIRNHAAAPRPPALAPLATFGSGRCLLVTGRRPITEQTYDGGVASRPDWWEPWIPERDGEGHELSYGDVRLSWENCPGCPGAPHGRGHHVIYCRTIGCRSEPVRPPGHVGPGRDQH